MYGNQFQAILCCFRRTPSSHQGNVSDYVANDATGLWSITSHPNFGSSPTTFRPGSAQDACEGSLGRNEKLFIPWNLRRHLSRYVSHRSVT